MKVEQKFIVTIKDSPFELSKQEAESLYYELQKELGLMPRVNTPSVWPVSEPAWWKTTPICDPVPFQPKTGDDLNLPYWTVTCASFSTVNSK